MIGSLVMAFQSVIILMVLTRVLNLAEAGIFTIANANANLMLTIGKYGMRNYQVSDVNKEFSFTEYLCSRWICIIGMLFFSAIYVLIASKNYHYSMGKALIILLMCVYKIPDAFEDIYYGEYQRRGRLDIAAKAMTIRMSCCLVLYLILIIIFKNQLIALSVSIVFSFILLAYLIQKTKIQVDIVKQKGLTNVPKLMKECFPLFIASFLSFYIGNAPKYAIDALLSDEIQACYGFISMPVFIIGLLNSFVYNPIIYRISCVWKEKKMVEFIRIVVNQLIVVAIITVCCEIGACILGIPVLSIIYNTNLGDYKIDLLILLLGGGFLGAVGLMTVILTIMRKNNCILLGYLVTAFLAFSFSNVFIAKNGVRGASIWYMLLMIFTFMFFISSFLYEIMKHNVK